MQKPAFRCAHVQCTVQAGLTWEAPQEVPACSNPVTAEAAAPCPPHPQRSTAAVWRILTVCASQDTFWMAPVERAALGLLRRQSHRRHLSAQPRVDQL